MLTSDEKRQIEEEELKRAAAERYRAEVREQLSQGEAATRAAKPGRPSALVIVAMVVVLGGALFVAYDASRSRSAAGAQTIVPARYVEFSDQIADGQITIPAGKYVSYRITITPDMLGPEVTGDFSASGGIGNDLQAILADGMNMTNWVNGHQASVLWSTPGRETEGMIQAKPAPGEYYLILSNQQSLLASRQVFLHVKLNYRKRAS